MEAVISMLSTVLFPPLSPKLMPIISAVTLISISGLGFMEIIGLNLQYSKFLNSNTSSSRKKIVLSSRTGMLSAYTPALLVGVSSFFLFPNDDFRFLMLKSAVTLHFMKRILEVLFVHKFSGGMALDTAILISLGYLGAAIALLFAQHLTQGLPQPPVDLKYPGVVLFLVGISGNFYHHRLLASLRKSKSEQGYKIPEGGLFGFVICPHYLFEILGFFGISMISQTLVGLSVAIGVVCYLTPRSYLTRKWYLSKFEDFPKNVKALIPFVF